MNLDLDLIIFNNSSQMTLFSTRNFICALDKCDNYNNKLPRLVSHCVHTWCIKYRFNSCTDCNAKLKTSSRVNKHFNSHLGWPAGF